MTADDDVGRRTRPAAHAPQGATCADAKTQTSGVRSAATACWSRYVPFFPHREGCAWQAVWPLSRRHRVTVNSELDREREKIHDDRRPLRSLRGPAPPAVGAAAADSTTPGHACWWVRGSESPASRPLLQSRPGGASKLYVFTQLSTPVGHSGPQRKGMAAPTGDATRRVSPARGLGVAGRHVNAGRGHEARRNDLAALEAHGTSAGGFHMPVEHATSGWGTKPTSAGTAAHDVMRTRGPEARWVIAPPDRSSVWRAGGG
jgi:hypothetical protein